MTFSQDIEQALSRQLREFSTGTSNVSEPRELRRMVEAIRERYGGGKAGLATPDRLEAAVLAVSSGAKPSNRQLLFLAHGFSRPIDALAGQSVLDSKLGAKLLRQWEAQALEGRLSPMHWRGLFRSFMQAEARKDAERLRRLLSESAGSLAASWRKPPSWWEAVVRHQTLLGTSPCNVYMQEMLDEESKLLDDLRSNTDVPPGSWFWKELVKPIRAGLTALSDGAFLSNIPYLLTLPERIPGSRDEILAATLSRHAQCVERSRHAELLQFALDAWRSPQLRSNNLWELAGTAAKQMVCGWLAQEDLEDFYHVCRGQTQIDERRLRFWLRFTRQMDYTQILLGGEIRHSWNADVRSFIAKKKGRLGDLTSGPSSNNAILMQIGPWVFIEFSETGNACYGYPVSGSNIRLGGSRYSIHDLKQRYSASSWLTHSDGRVKWEQTFLQELRKIGVFPDADDSSSARQPSPVSTKSVSPVTPAPRSEPSAPRLIARSTMQAVKQPVPAATVQVTQTAPAPRDEPNLPESARLPPDDVWSDPRREQLVRALKSLNVTVDDRRPKGGALWAILTSEPAPHAELIVLGMRYKAARNGYYLP